jgi:hypothetical protein
MMMFNAAWQKALGRPRSKEGQHMDTRRDSTPTSVQCIMLKEKKVRRHPREKTRKEDILDWT